MTFPQFGWFGLAAIRRTFGRIAAIYYCAPKTCRSQSLAAASCGYAGTAARFFHSAPDFCRDVRKSFFQAKSALQTVGLIT
jgi:hypothetical protein